MTRTFRPSTRESGFTLLGLVILIALISLAAIVVIPYVVRSAELQDASTVAEAPHMVPEPVVFAALGGVTVELRQVDAETKRFVFVVRGAEVTALPQGLPMAFEFDTPVQHLSLISDASGILVTPHSTKHTVTCVLRRNPFAPPVPWWYTVQITLEALPRTGRITVGTPESYNVIYQVALAPSDK